jgi:hypothetical protein
MKSPMNVRCADIAARPAARLSAVPVGQTLSRFAPTTGLTRAASALNTTKSVYPLWRMFNSLS